MRGHKQPLERLKMRAMKLGICINLTLILFGCQSSSSPTGPKQASTEQPSGGLARATASQQLPENFPIKRILCFGDSVTLGVTLRRPYGQGMTVLTGVEGYPPKLGRLLEESYGTGFELITRGVGGELTKEGLGRIDTEIRRTKPDLVLILEGIVDVNNEFARFPLVRGNLAEMMRLVKHRGLFVIIGTMPLLNGDGFRTGGAGNVPRLNNIIRQEAKAKNVPVADHEKAFGTDYRGQGPDGLHPNNIGYEIMAQTWFEQIQIILSGLGFPSADTT